MKFLFTTFCFIFVLIAPVFDISGQDTTAYINSGELISRAVELHDKQEYDSAMSLYKLVTPSDTNYAWSIAEQMFTLNAQEKFEEVIELAKVGLEINSAYKASIYSKLATAYDYNDQLKESIEVFKTAVEKYPYFTELIYNYGVTLRKAGEYDEAQKMFIKRLELTPFHASSHLQLAELSVLQGFRSKALMSYLLYLAISPSSTDVLAEIEDLLIDKSTFENTLPPYSANGFEDLDALIRAKVAIGSTFKPGVKLDYRITRHAEFMIKQLANSKENDDFWSRFYTPFYKKLSSDKLTPAFLYSLVSAINKEDIQNWIKKNQKKITELGTMANTVIQNFRLVHKTTLLGIENDYSFWYFDNGVLNVIGNSNSQEQNIGAHVFYFSNGEVSAKGLYDMQGKKIGDWYYYNPDGTLQSKESYNQLGELHGPNLYYYPSGKVQSEVPYQKGIAQGTVNIFYECGQLLETYPTINNTIQGKGISYYPSGRISVEYFMENGVLTGPSTEYYESGAISSTFGYKESEIHGSFLRYHENGTLAEKGEYLNGEFDGPWIGFHSNGNKQYEFFYRKGIKTDIGRLYSEEGILIEEYSVDSTGANHGEYKNFDEDGKLHSIGYYTNGLLNAYKYFDKDGKVIAKGNNKDSLHVTGYSPLGYLLFEADYIKGKMNGLLTYYHSNGNVKYTVEVKDDNWEGEYLEYYLGGELKTKTYYSNNQNNGWHYDYHQNGQISSEAMMVNDKMEQWLIAYHLDGMISQKTYHRDGQMHGQSIAFGPEGRIFTEQEYKNGDHRKLIQYDQQGNIVNIADTPAGSGLLEARTPSGFSRLKQELKCGQVNGFSTFYYANDQIDTRYTTVFNKNTGPMQTYYPNGQKRLDGHLKEDLPDSTWIWYDMDGTISSRENHKNGLTDGVSTDYFPDGQIRSQCNMKKDEKHGTCKYYSSNGELRMIKTYDYSVGILNFQYELPNGELSTPEKVDVTARHKLIAYYKNEQKSVEQTYYKGLLEGRTTYYYPNGKVEMESDIKNGVDHGWERFYYENGQLKSEIFYIHGEADGTARYFHKDGSLQRTIEYKLGLKQGNEIWYSNDGKVSGKFFFWNNVIFN